MAARMAIIGVSSLEFSLNISIGDLIDYNNVVAEEIDNMKNERR